MEKRQDHCTGLVSVSFRAHTPREILCAMQKAGLRYIEWGSDVHAPCRDVARLDELAALQSEFGISCCSYGTYFRLGQTPIDELEHYILAAKRLGTDTLRVWCGTRSGADMTDAEIADLLDACRKAAEMAKAHGVVICTECHRGTFTERPDDALWLLPSRPAVHREGISVRIQNHQYRRMLARRCFD